MTKIECCKEPDGMRIKFEGTGLELTSLMIAITEGFAKVYNLEFDGALNFLKGAYDSVEKRELEDEDGNS